MPSWEDKLTEEERCDLRRYRWITESIYRSLAASRRCVEATKNALECRFVAQGLSRCDPARGYVCSACRALAVTEADFMEG